MAAPKREQLANNAFALLDGGIDDTVTTLDVDDGSVFPATGNFRIRIDDEILLVTARSTDTLTVVRGQEGSAAAAHSNGVDVVSVLTAGALDRWGKDNVILFGYSGVLPRNKIVNDAGDTELGTGDFTWVNQGSSTVTAQGGTMVIKAPVASGENIRALALTAPSAPYSYIMAMNGIAIRESFQHFGVGFRQSSSGKLTTLALVTDGTESRRIAIYKHTNPTTFSTRLLSEVNLLMVSDLIWFKLEDNNTNTIYYISMDGIEWIQIASESRTTFFLTTGPDQVWWGAHNSGSSLYTMQARLHHWSRAS